MVEGLEEVSGGRSVREARKKKWAYESGMGATAVMAFYWEVPVSIQPHEALLSMALTLWLVERGALRGRSQDGALSLGSFLL